MENFGHFEAQAQAASDVLAHSPMRRLQCSCILLYKDNTCTRVSLCYHRVSLDLPRVQIVNICIRTGS